MPQKRESLLSAAWSGGQVQALGTVWSMYIVQAFSLISDADPDELLYRSGSRARKSSIRTRIRIQGKFYSQILIFKIL